MEKTRQRRRVEGWSETINYDSVSKRLPVSAPATGNWQCRGGELGLGIEEVNSYAAMQPLVTSRGGILGYFSRSVQYIVGGQ